MEAWCLWLIVSGVFFVIEIITTGFLVFWLGLGALIAMAISFLTESFIIQAISFIISSSLLILLTKPLVNKYINVATVPTNSYSLIEKVGIVVSDIDPLDSSGQVKINGEIWSAKSFNNERIKKDTKVKVLKIEGVKLIVTENTEN